MPGRVVLVYGQELMKHFLGEHHPMQPIRVQLAVELIQQCGLMEHAEQLAPRLATDDEIAMVHGRHFIEVVRRLSDPHLRDMVETDDIMTAGFASADNPVNDLLHEGTAWVVGAALVAAEEIHEGRATHAFSPAGGLHHAMRDRASGFCVYDDPAIAIRWLQMQGHRVAYIDVDVHHGDGVERIFYDDPDVLTISLHESGRYLFPGTGFPEDAGRGAGIGTAVNLPFLPFTWDEPWLEAFERVIPAMLRRFRPTIIVTQDGCDQHLLDPQAHLACTTHIWPRVGRTFHELAHELCEGRWLALGGGGYAIREVVPRAWTLLFAEMVQHPELATHLDDPDEVVPGEEAQHRVWASLRADIARLEEVHGIDLSAGRSS